MTLSANSIPLHSMYLATEGEGVHIGHPQVFVRFQGCAIACRNCDSKNTWKFDDAKNVLISKVVEEVKELATSEGRSVKRVSITGGDPMDPRFRVSLINLIREFKTEDFWINIEASGLEYDEIVFNNVDFISMDIKPPSTGVQFLPEPVLKTIENYHHKLQLKSVVADKRDYEFNMEMLQLMKRESQKDFPWVLTPCFEPKENFPEDRFKNIIMWNELNGSQFRVIGQQHKWVFGPSATNV